MGIISFEEGMCDLVRRAETVNPGLGMAHQDNLESVEADISLGEDVHAPRHGRSRGVHLGDVVAVQVDGHVRLGIQPLAGRGEIIPLAAGGHGP